MICEKRKKWYKASKIVTIQWNKSPSGVVGGQEEPYCSCGTTNQISTPVITFYYSSQNQFSNSTSVY